jgi:predicted hotdog family 3-hydroxylacyl-ACP dehydratase
MSDADAPPIEELIPHSGGSILLDRVIAHDPESTTAKVTVGSRRWLRQPDGSVASWLAIEYMAQCVAAHEGMLARAAGRKLPPGFLVSVTGLRLGAASFRGNEQLRVRTRRIRGRPGLGVLSHRCAIFADADADDSGAEPVAEGRLSIVVERSGG